VGCDTGGLGYATLDVAGVERGYWLARGPEGLAGPLLMVLHGSGTNGKDVATLFTGLATRGPAAGVVAVFPDGWRGVWHIARPPRGAPALDDAAFLAALARSLRATSVILAGISNGAGFAEHVARHGLLPVAGLFLVTGTFREFSRQAQPVPRQRAAVTILARTAAPVETVARDWAAANGAVGEPASEPLAQAPGDPPVTRLTWSAPGGPPVVLYRIDGGGHGWPGGPQYLSARVIGPVPRRLDATGLLLDLVYQVTAGLPPG
jgi:polyhydroxybutyrate depolymerase